jgi:hypothetical protein
MSKQSLQEAATLHRQFLTEGHPSAEDNRRRMKITRAFLLFGIVLLVEGCVSPSTYSTDAQANYQYVFGDVNQPKPIIVNCRLERYQKSFLGMTSEHNGDWEFEVLAPRAWLDQIEKQPFIEVPFTDVRLRRVPEWFAPTPNEFTAWKLPGGSYYLAHLFVEKNPSSKDKIRAFICRH